MITRLWFHRSITDGTPAITIVKDGVAECHEIAEDMYMFWVPDSYGPAFIGESLSEGVYYDKELIPNLKAVS